MRLTQICIERPVTTFMFFLAVLLLGLISLKELSVDLLPDLSYPRFSIITQYAGASPGEIESTITLPLEAAVSTVPGLHRLESLSKEGISYLVLEFNWGTNMDFAVLRTRERLDNARYRLPEEAERPTIIPLDPQSRPIMILAVSGLKNLRELKGISTELIKPRLEQTEGIGSAEVIGGIEREIQVEINPRLLALYGLTINQIARRIDEFNRSLQGGSIRKGQFRYALRIEGEFRQIHEIGEISLQTTDKRGVLRLKDVAQIRDSIKERTGTTKLNGEECIGILVRKEAGENTVKVTQKARIILRAIEKENPQLQIFVVSDQAKYIENAISTVVKAIIFGSILAFLVLSIFLQDLKTPIIIAVVIPVSVMATFNFLYFGNVTLNIMSLGGLALGIGMFVDNSIIVSESISRKKSESKDLLEAVQTGTKEVGMAVTASTLTTISVFLPVLYVHGVAGKLFKDQALTVSFALLSSLLVSLSLLPLFSSRKLELRKYEEDIEKENQKIRTDQKKEKKTILKYFIILKIVYLTLNFFSIFVLRLFFLVHRHLRNLLRPVVRIIFTGFNIGYQEFSSIYHKSLLWSLENKAKILSGFLLFLGLTIFLFTQIKRELMPKPETFSFELSCRTPGDYSLEQTEDIVSVVEKWLKDEGIKMCFSRVGLVSGLESSSPDISLNSARIQAEFRNSSELEEAIENIRKRLKSFPDMYYSLVREKSPLAQSLAFQNHELSLKIKGENLGILKSLAEQLIAKLRDIDGITDLSSNIEEGKPEYLLKIKKDALERYANISPALIGSQLVNAVRGKIAAQFKEIDRKYDILVRGEKVKELSIDSLLNMQFPYGNTLIPFRELVSCDLVKGSKEIRRENQRREVLVTANLKNTKISQLAPKIMNKIDELLLPSNYQIIFNGQQEEMKKSFRSLIIACSLAVLLVYMIVAAQFESLLHPFLILITLPLGLSGAVWALFLTGQTLNVISIIGMVASVGIAVNDAIVKIDYTNQLRKTGLSLREAVIRASRVRLRPILMTTMTTIFGLLPLSLGLGKGAELQKPLAVSVIGGLIFATFLTLILIPVAYELLERRG